ncbi:hypothetical protein D3C84_476090 [compost metagenome]
MAASVLGSGRPAKAFFVIAIQCGTTAGVARVEEEVLHVDRDELLRTACLVDVRAAGDLPVVLFALATTADVLLPPGEVKQARIVAEGKTSIGLAPAFVRNANQARTVTALGAALNQFALGIRPQARTIINMSQLMQDGGQHFPAHGAVGAISLFSRGAAVREAGQQVAIQIELRDQRRLSVGILGHVIGPADINAPVQLLDEARRQCLHGFIEQGLAGLLLRGRQTFGLEL